MLAFLRRVRRLRPVRRALEHPRVARIAWLMLLGSLVRESATFTRRELQGSSVRGRYRLRRSGQTIIIRHGTLDIPTLAEIFLERQYEPPPAPVAYLGNLRR